MTTARIARIPLVTLVTLLAAGCRGKGADAFVPAGMPARASVHDPCSVLPRAEAEAVIGPLAGDPYRTTDDPGQPDPAGRFCVYRTAEGRPVKLGARWVRGAMEFHMANGTGRLLDQVGRTHTAWAGDTLNGPWDQAAVTPPGTLWALKGDELVWIDYSTTRGGLADGVRLVTAALPHLDHPVVSHGAEAATALLAHMPSDTARDPCSLVSRAEAERALGGALEGNPRRSSTSCVYLLAPGEKTPRAIITLDVAWTDGFQRLAQWRAAQAAYAGRLGGPASTATVDSAGGAQVRSAVQRATGTVAPDLSRGVLAASRDTASGQPWAESFTTFTTFYAVRHDVLLTIDLRTATPEQARAIAAIAASKL